MVVHGNVWSDQTLVVFLLTHKGLSSILHLSPSISSSSRGLLLKYGTILGQEEREIRHHTIWGITGFFWYVIDVCMNLLGSVHV